MPRQLTKKEIIKRLKSLELRWNNKYWLYSASGDLHLMKIGKDGNRIMDGTGFSQKAIVEDFNIPCDGGDW